MITCKKCRRELPVDEFSPDRRRPDGRRQPCRSCEAERQRQRRADPVAGAHIRERDRQRYAADPATRERAREYNASPPVRERDRQRHADDRAQVLAHYSPTSPPSCGCCGTTERLTLDHVQGGGVADRAERGGRRFYAYLVRKGFPAEPPISVLCWSCNQSKAGEPRCRLLHMEPLPFLADWLAAQEAQIRSSHARRM